MTFVRAVPAEQIEEIETAENDVEQEIRYTKDATGQDAWPAYDPTIEQTSFMLHFASNKPVGSPWGEADLSPLLVWIGRYSSWLEDRVRPQPIPDRLHVRDPRPIQLRSRASDPGKDTQRQPAQIRKRARAQRQQRRRMGNPVTLRWTASTPVDGLAIKHMIATGVGFPLHFLAEPESSTRTTAEAAGTPTFRTLEETQDDYFSLLADMARVAVEVRSRTDSTVNPKADIRIEGPDITERDNATLALALGRAYPPLADLFDRELIEAPELLRITYKMFAEVHEGKGQPTGKRKPLMTPRAQQPNPGTDQTDPQEPTDN